MDNCIFCKIVSGELPSFKIYEDEKYLAFLDIGQFIEGHTLVIPKQHYRFVYDIADYNEYSSIVKKIANHYRDLGYKYVDTLIFGRQIAHAHTQLLPHNDDDAIWNKATESMEEIARGKKGMLTTNDGQRIAAKFSIK